MAEHEGKSHVSIVVAGHVDAGKSSLTGRLLYDLGGINDRDMEKLRKIAEENGKPSFAFAYFMDNQKAERERGITIACNTKEFYTSRYHYTIIDAPGHRDFIKNMITGSSQADVALLLCPADGGSFIASIAKGDHKTGEVPGQTRNHARLLNLLGVKQLIIGVNKMDSLDSESKQYSQNRYEEVAKEMKRILLQEGWKKDQIESEIPIIPMAGFLGENILKKSDKMPWWNGMDVKVATTGETVKVECLLDALNKMVNLPPRNVAAPLRAPVSQCLGIKGVGDVLTMRIEQGEVAKGDEVIFLPTHTASNPCTGKVFSIEMHHKEHNQAGPGAEIGYLTSVCNGLFTTILSMSGSHGGGDGGGGSKVRDTMENIMERMPEPFEMVGINLASKPVLDTEEGPYVQVVLQECSRMNVLLGAVKGTLVELDKGLKGQLNMTQAMEDLATCLGTNFVPGRNPFHGCNWEGKAWFSLKSLDDWYTDLLARNVQLQEWTEELVRPFSMWLPGLFNPTAFITAVMQVTARHEGLALDKMTTETHMSRYYDVDTLEGHPPHDGAFVHGIFIEGARWPSAEELDDPTELAGVPIGGHIVDSKLKELLPMLPIIFLRAVAVQPQWEPSSVGYLRHDPHVYEAPMYITTFRGPTYVELATLDSADDTRKWVLAAVAVIFQSD